ncbi:hypothetical protein [uncultured Methanolobus sp.]|uniref:hypothetical protein n=1 Tax=uncultured Methanolobus sp. TaxID=218300 RepID=UPI0029C8A9AD|nr:hypothetical protein [uncultured Methanolobus sp.]
MAPHYDTLYKESDEPDYKLIVKKVKSELSDAKTISMDTFTAIMDWKAARAKGRVNWDRFDLYQTAIITYSQIPLLERKAV